MKELLKEFLISLLNTLGLAWWVEIKTEIPSCIYYFGPFLSAGEAKVAQSGYVEDLEQENAEGIRVMMRRCKPTILTIDNDIESTQNLDTTATLKRQL